MLRKPRPFKLKNGLAVVRPTRYEYLDGNPGGNSRQARKYLGIEDSSSESSCPPDDRNRTNDDVSANEDRFDDNNTEYEKLTRSMTAPEDFKYA